MALLNDDSPPTWARRWLIAAGIYNLLWGAAVIVAPHALFDAVGLERMQYPQIWQCVGMIVGVYGVGYLAAARDPWRHWPIVLVGLLGKVFGPIGFAGSLWVGDFPPAFGLTIITNDLIWWAPFTMILWGAARSKHALPDFEAPDVASTTAPIATVDEALDSLTDLSGQTLRDVARHRPTLVVFLRHSGCTFCREALADLAARRETLESRGYALAVVTLSDPDSNRILSERYQLRTAHWFSDPERFAYRAFELRRGNFRQLFGLGVVLRGAIAFLKGHGVGSLDGDGFQMPGAFVVHAGKIVSEYRHQRASDRPDYLALAGTRPSPS